MKLKTILTLLGALALYCSALAQTPPPPVLIVADDSSSGIYKRFWNEMLNVLKADTNFTLQFKESDGGGGAVGNLDALINNQASLAFLHGDVLKFRMLNSQDEDLSKFKVFMNLFPEEVHFLVKSATRKVGGTYGFGATEIKLTDVMSLGQPRGSYKCKVGAAGGGYVTASVINTMGQVGYEVVKFDSGQDVLAALDRNDIDAAVFVGASPLPNLEKLDSTYRFLPISAGLSDRLRSVYKPATITYTKMDPSPVATVSVKCMILSKTYKGKRMVSQLAEFRRAIIAGLADIQETPGNHPKWSLVDPTYRGSFPWLDLPGDPAPPKDPDDQN